MKKPITRTSVPYADKDIDVLDAYNQAAKVINSSFIDEDRILVQGSFSNTSGSFADVSVTFPHPFKVAPIAVVICGCLSGNYFYNGSLPSYRVSKKDETSVTITIRQQASSMDSFEFLILR